MLEGVTPAGGKGVAVGGGASQGCKLTKLEDSVSPILACVERVAVRTGIQVV